MHSGYILKSAFSPEEGDLEKINQYTRRPFTAEEIYTFRMVLCDNEVDRDWERFSSQALYPLAELFRGKTGIFNHSMDAATQSARIYDAAVVPVEGKFTSSGEPYCQLVAKAYMPRTEGNRDLILEIDGGIKKEVSVGCAMGSATCSICGADLRHGTCGHEKGKVYNGQTCCTVLGDPQDAYEWSFVAVPAQPAAGVTKGYGQAAAEDTDAAFGRLFRKQLLADTARYFSIAHPEIPAQAAAHMAAQLSPEELAAVEKALRKAAGKHVPLTPQLSGPTNAQADGLDGFRI